MRRERGLAEATICLYGDVVSRFLDDAFGIGEVRLGTLVAADIVCFVQVEAARPNHAKRAKVMTSALRSFLRYLRYRGDIKADLHTCVPTVANWSKSGLPRALPDSQVQRLLDACNRRTPVGRRDDAMLLLMARLGLRPSEVVDLSFNNIEWNEGAVSLRGPAQRCDRLPLPAEVGEALAE